MLTTSDEQAEFSPSTSVFHDSGNHIYIPPRLHNIFLCTFSASDRNAKFSLKHLSFMTVVITSIFLQDCIVIRLNPLPA